jgi:lipopolysaccharide transport system ATP-binding protein
MAESETVISAQGVSKRYVLKHQGRRASRQGEHLSEKIQRLALSPLDLFRRSGAETTTQEDFWALKDVSFQVKKGEILGVIGRNGAGKSTLLKILSRITEPTSGEIRIRGRVASLLEVGTGFHPELTGRENVFLNGAILGMSRQEIRSKFDEIVSFAEVEKFLDTPVKHYSSGMYVRLAFAVAAHLEPDILIVDEVLAVGDMAFQKKCLSQMEDTTRQGRTVLLVSHNMPTVLSLCSRAILLSGGQVVADGEPATVLETYQNAFREGAAAPAGRKGNCQIRRAWLGDDERDSTMHVPMSKPLFVNMEYEVARPDGRLYVPYLRIHAEDGTCVFHVCPEDVQPGAAGLIRATCIVPEWMLNAGAHHASLYVAAYSANNYEVCAQEPMALSFTVSEDVQHPSRYAYAGAIPGAIWPRLQWSVKTIGTP